MCTYLAKRGSTYYFRRTIPAELRPALEGRAEFMSSLRTKDRETAKRLIPARTQETDRLLDEAARATQARQNAPARPSQDVLDRVARMEHAIFERDLEGARLDSEEAAAEADDLEMLEASLRDPDAQRAPELRAASRLRGQLDAERDRVRRYRPRHYAALDAENGPAPASAPKPAPPERTGAAFLEQIVDMWAAERKPVKKGKDTHAAVARWFYERVGRKPVADITRHDVLAFKNKLVAEGQSLSNTNMKLSRLRTLLQWAADNEHAAINAGAGITVRDTDRARNRRREFDLASLNSIFGSPVFAAGARPAGGKGEAAYWLPLLALFTGARMEELGQLRPSDVAEIAYPDASGVEQSAWFIHIKADEAEGLRLKNAASERDVPVHPELVRLGFLDFAAKAKEAGQARLFPALRPNVYGRLTAKWGEWFGGYLRNTCGVADRRMVFHSFRHTFKQYARLAGIVEGVQRQIMGHSPGDVADEYGSGYPLHQVVEGMRLFRVPGLKL